MKTNFVATFPTIDFPLKLEKDELLKLIDVHEPYYALNDVCIDENNFASARVKVEQPLGDEVFPVSSAEASRHMAILGSVICAHNNPVKKKHYYLAHCGSFERLEAEFNLSSFDDLIVHAYCTSIDRRKACAQTLLVDKAGTPICQAEIFYHVIPYNLFDRLFEAHFTPFPDYSVSNPYQLKNPLNNVVYFENQATASMGKIPEFYCSGHFPNYPALPVAILINSLMDLAGKFVLNKIENPKAKLLIREFALSADNLGFAKDAVELSVKLVSFQDECFVINCLAIANGTKSIGDVKVTMQAVQ